MLYYAQSKAQRGQIAKGVSVLKLMNDYSWIRGVCYGWNRPGSGKTLEDNRRELGYAKRLNINSTRIWLSYQAHFVEWKRHQPCYSGTGVLGRIRRCLQHSSGRGIEG